jgi:hypothetical protein
MLNLSKPHKGIIKNWSKHELKGPEEKGLGYLIVGTCVNHPRFGYSKFFHTSYVVEHNEETGEIETRNSRYTLEKEHP